MSDGSSVRGGVRRARGRRSGGGGDGAPDGVGPDLALDVPGGLGALLTPHRDERMERVVLACLILFPEESWPYVDGRLTEDDFYNERHRAIFSAVVALLASGRRLDMHTLTAGLGPHLDAVGGATYLGDLCEEAPTAAHVEQYVADLAQAGTLRAAQRVALDTALAVATRPAEEALAVAAGMQGALDRRGGRDALAPASDVMVEVMERIERGSGTGGRVGRTYGLRDLDALTGGATGGQLIIKGARPAMGKTSAAVGEMVAMARESKAAGEQGVYIYFSLEMPRREIGQRAACQMGRVDESKVRRSLLDQADFNALLRAADEFGKLPVLIDDESRTIQELRSACMRARMRHGAVLGVFIDYLQLVNDDAYARKPNASRENEVSAVSRALKALAKKLDCPIIALAQLNRKCEERADKRPMISDLREAGGLEQDADVVMFIYRDEVYNKNSEDRGVAEIIVAKQRSGPTDTVRARFIRHCTRFEDLAADEPWAKNADGGAGDFGADDAPPPFEE